MIIESISKNELRIGRLTSSKAFVLMTNDAKKTGIGAKGLTYINQKKRERLLGRSIEIEKYSRPKAWGHFLEQRVHELLGIAYESVGDVTIQHPDIEYWVGTPDLKITREAVVAEIKCYEPDNFSWYVDALMKSKSENSTEYFKNECPEEYWQLVSNACILKADFIEAVAYMPYFSELPEIRDLASGYEGYDQWKYRFIQDADYSELPYLPDGGYYKNLNVFRFPVNEEDMQSLKDRIRMAGKMLGYENEPAA